MKKGRTPIRLSDYQEPPYWIDHVALTFRLHPTKTQVLSEIRFRPNDALSGGPHDLWLDGRDLKLISVSIDGKDLKQDQMNVQKDGLTIPAEQVPQQEFTFAAEVEINPSANTALEGLYLSNGMYCTQCEAQGFRKITYYCDRPDVLARFDVAIESDLPVLLSNGNRKGNGNWQDPWPKPSYLFALVAGDLVAVKDQFTTMSGRKVDLEIWVRPGDQDRCDYALDALKRSMAWDEREYGREYDLDLFMIVAVDDFNMGAMENKGLNIFNAKYVLASPKTATDLDYARIEAIIAHEYFHNWTGNRITCRDWFQLCLKEGLTVFRDQQFSGDERSHPVKRIEDVKMLRARQFREDAGPLAHPVRPQEYYEINNFYTATVYEKGAEVIGMLKRLVGDDAYRKSLDLYFDRFDGQACTIEDWLAVFEEATGRDLSQFALWYHQAGTPEVKIAEEFEGDQLTLTVSQNTAPTPGQPHKSPLHFPLVIGLLGQDGQEVKPSTLLEISKGQESFTFDGLAQKPVVSALRQFSAPVVLNHGQSDRALLLLAAADPDAFVRWEALQKLSFSVLRDMIVARRPADEGFCQAMVSVIRDEEQDPAFRAMAMTLPGEETLFKHLSGRGEVVDPLDIHMARHDLMTAIGTHMSACLIPTYEANLVAGKFDPRAEDAGKRALRNNILSLLTHLEMDGRTAKAQFATATNMTDQLAALSVLVRHGLGDEALSAFYDQWQDDRLVVDKWFSISALCTPPKQAAPKVTELTEHPAFNWKNPNRFRSLFGAFSQNHAGFHRADGEGYRIFMDWLIRLDPINPQTTARMLGAFETWTEYDRPRRKLIRNQLIRLAELPDLSKDCREVVEKIRA